jgi:hypothetical protein
MNLLRGSCDHEWNTERLLAFQGRPYSTRLSMTVVFVLLIVYAVSSYVGRMMAELGSTGKET